MELDFSPDAEHLNVVFGECLVKYIDVLGRKGCCRTALECCKLLLGLNPEQDMHGVLLRIDYYANRAREFEYQLSLMNNFDLQVYNGNPGLIPCIKLMPNLMMTSSLAYKALCTEEESKTHNDDLETCVQKLNSAVETGTVRELFSPSGHVPIWQADMQVLLTLLLYP